METRVQSPLLAKTKTKEKQRPENRVETFIGNAVRNNEVGDIENRLVVAKGEVGWGGKDWEFGISRCKLVYIK